MFEFELEKGSKKFTCPNCGTAKKFKRYVSRRTFRYAPTEFGRCDRESSCGYHHYPTKEYFADNPQTEKLKNKSVFKCFEKGKNTDKSNYVLTDKNSLQAKYEAETLPKKPDYISNDIVLRTLTGFDRNAFVQFLLNLFCEDEAAVWQAVKDYFIGTSKAGDCIFWQIDQMRRVRTGKIMRYGADGHRQAIETYIDKDGETRELKVKWIHAELKRARKLKADFNLRQCFFGEHLLQGNQKPAAIVEAEKTAFTASICFPEFVWLGAGSATNLSLEKLLRFKDRRIILYPDANLSAFDRWQKIAREARLQGGQVKLSNLIEKRGTEAEKREGFDLADYLISEQTRINQYNRFADSYNAKLETVLRDEILMQDFETVLDEQKSVLVIDGNLSDAEAENLITEFENLRQIVEIHAFRFDDKANPRIEIDLKEITNAPEKLTD